MDLFTDFVRALENPLLLYLTELFLKGFLIVALFGLLACAVRPGSAAIRHLLWLGGLGSLLVLPFTVGLLPSVPVPVFTPEAAPAVRPMEEARTSSGPVAAEPVTAEEATVVSVSAGGSAPPERASAGSVLPVAVLAIWIGGGLLAILPLACAGFRLRRCVRRARELASPEWRTLLEDCCETLGLRRSVRLLEGPAGLMPMTWGIRRPVILLPGEADSWPLERRRSVLLHELAHIKRNDCLSQLLARAACAVHWFNPLAWLAYRRVLATRERACDDLVLLADGMKPSDYAKHLLSIAREFRTGFPLGQGAIPMARNSALEGRVRAVLGDGNRRRGAGRNLLLATVLGSVAAAMAAGVIGPNAAAQQENDPEREPRQAEATEDSRSERKTEDEVRRDRYLKVTEPVRRIERNRVTVNDLGEEVSDPFVINETQMDEGFFNPDPAKGAAHQYLRVGPALLEWSLRTFNPPRERTGYAYMWAVVGREPRWEFALCAQNSLWAITREDLPTEFYGMNDPRGPEVFGERWSSSDYSVIVAEGDILFARLVSDPSTVYAIKFAEQGSSDHVHRREDVGRDSWGKMRIEYIVFPPEGTDVSIESEPKSSGESARSSANESEPEGDPTGFGGGTMESSEANDPEEPERIPGKDGVPPLPTVRLEFAYFEVTDRTSFLDLFSAGGFDEYEIREVADELTEIHSALPGDLKNSITDQITAILSEPLNREQLVEVAERPGIELLSRPSITTATAKEAVIWIGRSDDPAGVGIKTKIVPTIREDGTSIFVSATSSAVEYSGEGEDVADGESRYRVRQITLDDFEIRSGRTAIVGGFTEGDAEEDKELLLFITPEIEEPSSAEAGSGS